MTTGRPTRAEVISRLLAAAAAAAPDVSPEDLQDTLVAALPSGADRIAWIEQLVDEGRAAWDLLLGCADRGHLLLGGAGWSAATLALARRWDRVTVIDPDPAALTLLERRCDAAGITNLSVVRDGAGPVLPLADASCDAVAWLVDDEEAPPCADRRPGSRRSEDWPSRFLAEAARVLRPGGGLFLAVPGPWRRGFPLRGAEPAALSLRAFAIAAATSGLIVARRWSVEGQADGPRSWVDLDDPAAIADHMHVAPVAARRLPRALFRFTAPRLAMTASRGSVAASWLEGALSVAALEIGLAPGSWRTSPPNALRKGKLVVTLRADDGRGWIAKVPLRDDVAAAMRHGQRVLAALTENQAPSGPLRRLLPALALDVEHRGRRLHVESLCVGHPWATHQHGPIPLQTGIASVLKELLAQDPSACGLDDSDDVLPLALDDLAGLLRRLDPSGTAALNGAASFLAEGRAPRLYLRKGDLSLSNVFLEGNRVSGLIDWDETGVTRHPLAPLGDLLFSWLWQREGWSRTRSLATLVGGRFADLPPALDIPGLLAALGRRPDDLTRGVLASWLEHVYHELQHPLFRCREDRLSALLVQPCRELGPALTGRR